MVWPSSPWDGDVTVAEGLTAGPPVTRLWTRWPVLLPAAATAALVTWLTLAATGSGDSASAAGVPSPDAPVAWLVPTLRLAGDLVAVLTVGCLLGAVVLLPGDRLLSAAGYRWVRSAGWSAAVWCLLSLVGIPALLSEFLGRGFSVISPASVVDFVTDSRQAQAQVVVAALAALVAMAARAVLTMSGAVSLLLVALLAALPPALAGHAGSTGGLVAPTAVALHILGVVLWAGGLVALVVCRTVSVTAAGAAVSRFSRLAGPLVVLVGASGAVTALTRLPDPVQLLTTSYGLLVLIKLVAFVGLVVVGAWHRRCSLPALASGRPAAFLRLLTVEVLLFGATVGVAVGLSRTPSPTAGGASAGDGGHAVLGASVPVPLSPGALLDVHPDLFFAVLATTAVAFYVAGLRRMAAHGRRWPPARSAAWFAGWALVLLVTNSGLARYGAVLSSVYVVQHLTLSLAAPLLMVLGRPGVMATAVLRPAVEEGTRGPREWLHVLCTRPVIRAVAHPLAALALFMAINYSSYVTGLYGLVLRSRLADAVFSGLSLASGVVFFRALLGAAETDARDVPPPSVRMVALMGWALGHGAVALFVLRGGSLLAADWWSEVGRLWGPMPIEDQYLAGRIAATYGVAMLFATVLAILWPRRQRSAGTEIGRCAERGVEAGSGVEPGERAGADTS